MANGPITLDELCNACGEPFSTHVVDSGIDSTGAEWSAIAMCDAWILARYPIASWGEQSDPVTGHCTICGHGYAAHWTQRSVSVSIESGGGNVAKAHGGNASGAVVVRLPWGWAGCPE